MSSPVATVGLTYDGTDLQASDLQVFFEVRVGLNESPSVRGTDIVVPALAGRIEGSRVNDVLHIELVGFVRADPSVTDRADAIASFRNNQQAIRTLFAHDRARADLVATLEDGSVYTISARPMNGIWNQHHSEIATASIELEGYGDWVVSGS